MTRPSFLIACQNVQKNNFVNDVVLYVEVICKLEVSECVYVIVKLLLVWLLIVIICGFVDYYHFNVIAYYN